MIQFSLREKCPYSELFWSVLFHIRTEYGKIRTRITPNTATFYAVFFSQISRFSKIFKINESFRNRLCERGNRVACELELVSLMTDTVEILGAHFSYNYERTFCILEQSKRNNKRFNNRGYSSFFLTDIFLKHL